MCREKEKEREVERPWENREKTLFHLQVVKTKISP